METILIRVLQFILAISLLVLLHEGGHMFFSKLFGVRVEKFFIFFDVSIGKWKGSLFSWKPKNSDTEYGIGWLPLGGYCKISGMIDESMDTEQMKQPPQSWEFRTKPAWQRLLIMIGGVLVNFVLALFIYSMIMFAWGESYYKVSDMKMGMVFNNEAKELGFKDGDVLLGTDQGDFDAYMNVNGDFFRQIAQAHRVDVIRQGKKVSIPMPGNLDMLKMVKSRPLFASPLLPTTIDSIDGGGPAVKAGIKAGDKIIALNGVKVNSWAQYDNEVAKLSDVLSTKTTAADSLKVRTVMLTVSHKATNALDTLKMTLTPDLRLGVYQTSLSTYYKPVHRDYTLLESFPAGVKYGWNILSGYVSNFRYLASVDGAKSLGGFGSIGSMFPPFWDWHMFWNMTAFLSIILAFMNILPIPALDGGHVMFLLYEMITRRKPSEKFMIYAEYVGIAILLLLMVVANLNDILRWIGWM